MERDILEIVSTSHQETFKWGEQLANLLDKDDIVALVGELGSGKTVFTQGICAGLHVRDDVTSPSFTLVQEYEGRIPVFHFDFYRLETPLEVEDLDIDGYMMAGGICIIEWAERGEPLLPKDRISVTLDRIIKNGNLSVGNRMIRITGPKGRGLLDLRLPKNEKS